MSKLKRENTNTARKVSSKITPPLSIVVDEQKNWVFNSEEELFEHFRRPVEKLEKEFLESRDEDDFSDSDASLMHELLEMTLDEPDQIWMDSEVSKDFPIYHFHRMFETNDQIIYYVVSTYLYDEDPTFVFLHFPTRSMELSDQFRRNQIVFDRTMAEFEPALIEGDGLTEGDSLSLGLFSAMLKVRSEKDIPMEDFRKFAELREQAIEAPDEIWRNSDFQGNRLVTFIKDFADFEGHSELHYIVVTQEDGQASTVHSLLFSFPTIDDALLDRYRNGENLQAEEVVQESSH